MRSASTLARSPLPATLLFGVGLALSLLMAWRSQLAIDQYQMLYFGWKLVTDGEWLPYGMRTSAGGHSPGGLLGLIMAIPLYFWRSYRAPAFFIVLLHAAAFLALARALRGSLPRGSGWLLLVFVWLNPWRIYFSAHVWDPNLMFVASVCHLLTAQKMAEERAAWPTALHVLTIGFGIQIHTSAAVLAFASALLFWRRMIRVHWPAFIVSSGVVVASLVPWILATQHDPTLLPGNNGFLFRGLVFVFPFLRGLQYWLQMPTLSLATRTLDFDFLSVVGPRTNAVLLAVSTVLAAIGHVTVLLSVWSTWRLFRRRWRIWTITPRPGSRSAWLESYIVLFLIASLLSFAITPTTVMFWQVLIALPASSLLLVRTCAALMRTKWRGIVGNAAKVWVALAISISSAQAVGAPLYRCGGRGVGVYDTMLKDLAADRRCVEQATPPISGHRRQRHHRTSTGDADSRRNFEASGARLAMPIPLMNSARDGSILRPTDPRFSGEDPCH